MSERAPQPERRFTAPGYDAKSTEVINVAEFQEVAPQAPESVRRDFGSRALSAQNPNAFPAPYAPNRFPRGPELPVAVRNVNDLPRLADGRRDYSSTSLGAAAKKPATWIRPLR